MEEIKTVVMIGVGAMGSFLAPRLYEAMGEGAFHIVAEGERKKRLEEQGLTINEHVYHFPVIEPGTKGHEADLIIIAVKSMALETALDQIESFVGADTQILPLLNGITSEVQVAKRYGWKHVLYTFMRVSVVMKDGCCSYDPNGGVIVFGEKQNQNLSERVVQVKNFFDKADIGYRIPEDMLHAQWFKFMANIGENLVCALLGVPFGAFTRSEHTNYLRIAAMKEVIRIAEKLGITLGEKELRQQEKTIIKIPFKNKPSTLQDLEAGKPTEIDMFAGEVMRLGEKLGVATPVNAVLYHAIRALEEKNDNRFQE